MDAEAPILWPPDVKSQLMGKDPDAGKDWGQEEKGVMTDDEMVGWHYQLNGREFEQILGDCEGQDELACCSSLGHKESVMTQWLDSNNMGYLHETSLREWLINHEVRSALWKSNP